MNQAEERRCADNNIDRRYFLGASAGALLSAGGAVVSGAEVLTSRPVGDVDGSTFYRHDIGTAPGRMHEPSVSPDGRIWTSPLDGNLWNYHVGSGEVEITDLQQLTGRQWAGLHLWPIAHENSILLCTPKLPQLWVWNRDSNQVMRHTFPHANPSVYGGFVVNGWEHIYLYDTQHQSVLKWDPRKHAGENFPCPYELSGTLYMSFVDTNRSEIWGSTYTGNDIVCFDVRSEEWTAHFKCPLSNATTTPGGRVFNGTTLYVSDHLNGRIVPLNIQNGEWGKAIPLPGYRDWFGYLSGGFLFRDRLYIDHSTWTGGTDSIDGEQYHFIGSWTIFDPQTHGFSRLDYPIQDGEVLKYLQSDYCTTWNDELYLLAVNQKPPRTVSVLRSNPME